MQTRVILFVTLFYVLANRVDGGPNSATSELPAGCKLRMGTALGADVSRESRAINSGSMTPDAGTVIVSSGKGVIKIWDSRNGKLQRELALQSDARIHTIWVSSAGNTAYAVGDKIFSIDLKSGRVGELQGALSDVLITTCAVSSDGSFIGARFFKAGSDAQCAVYDVRKNAVIFELRDPPYDTSQITFSADGRLVAMGGRNGYGMEAQGVIHVWCAWTGQKMRDWRAQRQRVAAVAFFPTGRLLVAGGSDAVARIWNVETGDLVCELTGNSGDITVVTVAPDGRNVAIGSSDGSIALWELASLQVRRRFCGHNGRIAFLEFSSDGKTLMSGSSDSTVIMWDMTRRSEDGFLEAVRQMNSMAEMERVWTALSADAPSADLAICKLVEVGDRAVSMAKTRTRPSPFVDRLKADALIAALDDPAFASRQHAEEELLKWQERAEPFLRSGLQNSPSPEKRQRIDRLLKQLGKYPVSRGIQDYRILELLERIGNDGARRVLAGLSAGEVADRFTVDAKAAYQRLRLSGTR